MTFSRYLGWDASSLKPFHHDVPAPTTPHHTRLPTTPPDLDTHHHRRFRRWLFIVYFRDCLNITRILVPGLDCSFFGTRLQFRPTTCSVDATFHVVPVDHGGAPPTTTRVRSGTDRLVRLQMIYATLHTTRLGLGLPHYTTTVIIRCVVGRLDGREHDFGGLFQRHYGGSPSMPPWHRHHHHPGPIPRVDRYGSLPPTTAFPQAVVLTLLLHPMPAGPCGGAWTAWAGLDFVYYRLAANTGPLPVKNSVGRTVLGLVPYYHHT